MDPWDNDVEGELVDEALSTGARTNNARSADKLPAEDTRDLLLDRVYSDSEEEREYQVWLDLTKYKKM